MTWAVFFVLPYHPTEPRYPKITVSAYNRVMTSTDSLGIGLYSVVEASRLLGTPRRTLSRWIEGYVQELRGGTKHYAPVIDRDQDSALTFGDLVELMYVRGFRSEGVDLKFIREVASKFRQEWQTQYPFATERFAANGKELLIGEGREWKHALTGQHNLFFEEIGKLLVHKGDLTTEWRPLGKTHEVILNPERAFGKPIDALSGAHTYVLAQAASEKNFEEVAWWYGTTKAAVEDSVKFEISLRAA